MFHLHTEICCTAEIKCHKKETDYKCYVQEDKQYSHISQETVKVLGINTYSNHRDDKNIQPIQCNMPDDKYKNKTKY